MKRTILTLFAALCFVLVQAQPLQNLTVSTRIDTLFPMSGSYSSIADGLIGGWVMTTTDQGQLSTDAMIVPTGTHEPTIFGGPRNDDVRIVTKTSDGGYLITGSFTSWGQSAFLYQGQPLFQDDAWPTGETQVFIIKTDKQMEYQWHRTFSAPAQEGGITLPVSALAGDVCFLVVQTQLDWVWYPTIIKLNLSNGLLLKKRVLLQEDIVYPYEPTDTLLEGQPSSQWTVGIDVLANGNLVIPFPGTDDGNTNMTDARIVVVDQDSLTVVRDSYLGSFGTYDQFFDVTVIDDTIVAVGVMDEIGPTKPRLMYEHAFDSTFADVGHALCFRTVDVVDSVMIASGSAWRASNNYLYSGYWMNIRKGAQSLWFSPFESYDGYAVDLQWSILRKDSAAYVWQGVGAYKSPGCYQDCDDIKPLFVEVRFEFPVDTTVIDTPTVIIEQVAPDVLLYPNPASSQTGVFYKTSERGSYQIFNLFGQSVGSGVITESPMLIQTESFLPGIYFIRTSNRTVRFIVRE